MGNKISDYVPTMTQELTNKVILYRRCSRKMAAGNCTPHGDGCSECPNYLQRAEFLHAMRTSHMIGKRKLKYKKIKE
jgi:hypothetical protein